MKRLRRFKWVALGTVSWGLLALLQSCANPMPCPGEPGAPMDDTGNEISTDGNGNNKQHLNTDCYYGRNDNGKIVLLTQKPQLGFWNSSVLRTDEQTPMNTHNNDENTEIEAAPNTPQPHQSATENNVTSMQMESMVTSNAPPPPPPPAPIAAAQPAPTDQQLYYRAGKVKTNCGNTMNVYRQASIPACPATPPPAPAPAPVIQRTYINNYPPVSVQTGEPPAQAAGAFLGGVGEDAMGAGMLTYAIRYRPDDVSSNSYSTTNTTVHNDPLAHARVIDPGHGFAHHPDPHHFHNVDPGHFHHPEPHHFHRPEPDHFRHPEAGHIHHPDPRHDHDALMGVLDK